MAAFKAQVAYPHALFAVIGDPHVYDPHVYDASLSSLWHGLPPADNDVDLSLGP
jgi:hypothetical protein